MFAILLAPMSFASPVWLTVLCLCGLCLLSDRVVNLLTAHKTLTGVSVALYLLFAFYGDDLVLGWFTWW